jgi:hypothetical protein
MDRISQHQHQGPGPARGHYPTQHASTIGNDREDALAKAKTIGELVAPVFSFPFTATYTSELEISDFEDTCGNIAEMTIEATGQNQIQSSHGTSRPIFNTENTVVRTNLRLLRGNIRLLSMSRSIMSGKWFSSRRVGDRVRATVGSLDAGKGRRGEAFEAYD